MPPSRGPEVPSTVTRYEWTGSTAAGEPKRGELLAESVEDVEQHLRIRGLRVERVRRRRPKLGDVRDWLWASAREKEVSGRQLQTMLEAGLPAPEAVAILRSVSTPALRRWLDAQDPGVLCERALQRTGLNSHG